MSKRYFSRVLVHPNHPEPRAICDRCGKQFLLSDLRWQTQVAGSSVVNRKLLVCKSCLDARSLFLLTVDVPQDPPVVHYATIEPYAIDEA